MFPHSRDKDGKPLFIIKAKSSVKGTYKAEEVQKVLGKSFIFFRPTLSKRLKILLLDYSLLV